MSVMHPDFLYPKIRLKGVFMSMSVKSNSFRLGTLLFLLMTLLVSACSSSKPQESSPDADNEVRYRDAVSKLEKKKYDSAIILLEPLMFSTRATALEDDVLFSLAKAYYMTEQYLLSADIYKRLLQQTPNSPFVQESQFQLAKSFEQLSPMYELDQDYTVRAINEFRIYLDLYPSKDDAQVSGDVETYRELLKVNPDNQSYKQKYNTALAELSSQSPARYAMTAIPVLREKLARNSFTIGESYVKLKRYRSAAIYYDLVIRLYPDTSFLEPAWLGKINVNVKRQKWFEARQAIEQYKQLFPDKQDKVEGTYQKVLSNFNKS
jgi:outer membrane protein assembly factor BamD